MAEQKKKDGQAELQMEEGGKSKKMLFIIIGVVVLIAGGVGGYLMMGSSEPEETLAEAPAQQAGGQAAPAATEAVGVGSALYVAMPRPFVFNVPGAARERLVQIKVQLLVRGEANEELAKKHIPLIEGTLLSVFSTANADDLATMAGKETLKNQALQEVQKQLADVSSGNSVVEKVLFTGFVMQ